MGREIGAHRFNWRSDEPRWLDLLMKWKSRQFRQTSLTDVFAFDWTRSLLRRILDQPTDAFHMVLSVLHAGDRPAAISVALRSKNVLHGWFTAFDPDLAKYSPGALLLLMKVEAAAAEGIETYHLGKGGDAYKRNLMTHSVPLAEGSIEQPVASMLIRRGFRSTRDWLRTSPLRNAVDLPARLARPARQWLSFR